ncbi:MAG: hypothetical protein ACXVFQ_15530 [Solirubrobacteraceae bacterium]
MNGSTLARFGTGVLIACCAVPGVALADTPTLNPSGTLTFSWQGDPARGCQAAGVCAVSGSLEVIPADQSGSVESPPSRDILIQDDGAVVRVADPGSTPTQPHICTQLTPVAVIVTIKRSHSGGLQAFGEWVSVPSSGDCAGPSAESFGAFSLPTRRLPGPREAYDLSTTQTFGSGPYTVTLRSTLRARRPPPVPASGTLGSENSSSGSFPGPVSDTGLVEHVSIIYRITRTSGTFTTTFAGRPDPFCVPLDACGASGAVTDAISGVSTRLEFDAQRLVSRRASRGKALADLRSGRLTLFHTGAPLANVLSANYRWPDGSACTARLRQGNAVSLNATGARHKEVLFSIATDSVEDPFRSLCPGPATGDVLGPTGTLARASLPLRELGRPSLRINLSRDGRFVAASYAGSHSGGVSAGLRLVHVRAGTTAENVYPGEP